MARNDRQKTAAVVALASSAAAVAVILFARWAPRADFDVTGILWLMQNIVPFAIVCVLFVFASGASIEWLRIKFKRKRSENT